MNILGIETSGRLGGVAVVQDEHVVAEIVADVTGRHVERTVWMINLILKRAGCGFDDLDAVAVSLGPGSFTGLRVGMATAKGLCFGKGLALVGVPTLDAIAEGASCWDGIIVPVRDARRGEVYFSIYKSDTSGVSRLCDHLALPPEAVVDRIDKAKGTMKTLVIGDALDRYGTFFRSALPSQTAFAPEFMWIARPAVVGWMGLALLREGKTLPLESAEPLYLRPSEAERKALRGKSNEIKRASNKTNERK